MNITPWQERFDPEGFKRGAPRTREAAMEAEINDLRAALGKKTVEGGITLYSVARPLIDGGAIMRAAVSDGYPVLAGCNLKLVYCAKTLALKDSEVL